MKTHELNSNLVNKACSALLKHVSSSSTKKSSLLNDTSPVSIQFTLQRVPTNVSLKPVRIAVPNPIRNISQAAGDGDLPSVCLFVKQESKSWVKEFVASSPSLSKLVKKVMGLQSLRKNHSRYSDKRELLRTYDFFLADDRILPMLSKALGKNFFEAKKQPVPIKLTRKESLVKSVELCLQSTYMFMPSGTCMNVKVGDVSMGVDKLAANVESVVDEVTKKIPKGWANVTNINIKTADSLALPFYFKNADELMETAKLAGVAEESELADAKSSKGKGKEVRELKKVESGKKRPREKEEKEGEKKAVVEVSEEDEEDDDDGEEEPKVKSPLVRALKKQKKEKEKEKQPKKTTTPAKSTTKTTTTKKTKEKEIEIEDVNQPKKNKETAKPTPEYIKAKKFTGPKKGMCFKLGGKGMGYYLDREPKFDAVGVQALKNSRVRNTPTRGGSQKRKKR